MSPGAVHALVSHAEWLAYSARALAQVRGHAWPALDERLKHGVKAELLPLVRLKGVGRVRARTLYNAGFTNPDRIRSATRDALCSLDGFGPATVDSLVRQVQPVSAPAQPA